MAVFNYKPRFSETPDAHIRQMQEAIQTICQKLSSVLSDLGEDNLSPELMQAIRELSEKSADVQPIKGKTANAYIGDDGQIYKILSE